MTTETVPVLFSLDELLLLQTVVRHEIAQSLNDQIAEALHLCLFLGQKEACLSLSRGDCLVLDAVVPANAKPANGMPLGMDILKKTIGARHDLTAADATDAGEPVNQPSKAAIASRLKEQGNDCTDRSPDDHPDDSAQP